MKPTNQPIPTKPMNNRTNTTLACHPFATKAGVQSFPPHWMLVNLKGKVTTTLQLELCWFAFALDVHVLPDVTAHSPGLPDRVGNEVRL